MATTSLFLITMDEPIKIFGFEELNALFEKLLDKKWVDDVILEVGEEFRKELKQTMPQKTGRARQNTSYKLERKDGYALYVIYGSKQHWDNVLLWNEHGTELRFREYKDKKRGIKFKEKKATGRMKKKRFLSKINTRYQRILFERMYEKLEKEK